MNIKITSLSLIITALALSTNALLAWGDAEQKQKPALAEFGPKTQSITAPLTIALKNPEPVADSKADGALAPAALDQDDTLAVKVSFEARRLLLRDLLHNLQQQSGIALQANINPVTRPLLITARVKDMPLAKLMDALSRMYGVRWAKAGEKSYLMLDGGLTAEQLKTLQIGDPFWFRYWEHTPGAIMQQQQDLHEIADEALNEADEQQLQSAAGVPLASLSPELQQKIRHHVESWTAPSFVGYETRARALLQQEWTLQVGLDPGVRTRQGDPMEAVRVVAADGTFITYLPLNTHLRPPAGVKLLPRLSSSQPPGVGK